MLLNDRQRGAALLVLICVASMVAAAQSLGLFGGGSPTAASPVPLPLALIAFTPVGFVGAVLTAFLVPFAWCTPLLRGSAQIPVRTTALALLVGAGSAAWFTFAQLRPLNSGGIAYTLVTATASLILFACTMLLIHRARRRPSLSTAALAHMTLFVWLFSYAFTWFGEVP